MLEPWVDLWELDGYTDVAAYVTHRFSGRRPFSTKATDTPASTPYPCRARRTGSVVRRMFTGDAAKVEAGYGFVEFVNRDGALDAVFGSPSTISFRERQIRRKRVRRGAAYSTAETVFIAYVSQVELGKEVVTVNLKDGLYRLATPHLTATFAGDNVLPNGLEGVADLAGKIKPQPYGKLFQVEPPCVNTFRLVFQAGASTIHAIDAVRDGGSDLAAGVQRTLAKFQAAATSTTFTVNTGTEVATTAGAHGLATGDAVSVSTTTTLPAPLSATSYYFARVLSGTTLTFHPTEADAAANTNIVNLTTTGSGTHTLHENTTLGGHYDWCIDAAGSYIRLGTQPVSRITMDVSGHSAANSTAAKLLETLAGERGITGAGISSSDVTALHAANSAVLGLWLDDARTTLDAMEPIARSVGAFFGMDRLDVLRMERFDAPGSTSDGTVIAPWNVRDVESVLNGEDIPTTTVRLRYARYHAPLRGADVLPVVSDADRADFGEEWRVAEDASTPSPNPHARTETLELETCFAYAADAQAEAARRLVLNGTPRRSHRCVDVQLDDASILALDINGQPELRWPRYGFSREVGTVRRVLEIEKDFGAGRATVLLWGE
jgi:hypothetical protein